MATRETCCWDTALLCIKAKLIVPITALVPIGRAVLSAAMPEVWLPFAGGMACGRTETHHGFLFKTRARSGNRPRLFFQ